MDSAASNMLFPRHGDGVNAVRSPAMSMGGMSGMSNGMHHSHDQSSHGGMMSMPMSMSNMRTTFYTSTATPLLFSGFIPNSTGAYAATCIFLVVLGALLRLLYAVRAYCEYNWSRRARTRRYVIVGSSRGDLHGNQTSPDPAVVLTKNGVDESIRIVEKKSEARHGVGFWANNPWRLSVDLPRACLFVVIAAVAYLLMLAVMTLNVGYFFSVLGGLFLGEILVGRFQQRGDDNLHHH